MSSAPHRTHGVRVAAALLLGALLAQACDDASAIASDPANSKDTTPSEAPARTVGFSADEAGLLWVYYDERGTPQTVATLADIPEGQREHVRVGFLGLDDPRTPKGGELLVADVRAPNAEGRYEARVVSREAFDAELAARVEPPKSPAATGDGDAVVVYGTSWCGACKQARSYLHARGVAFEDKDVERDPGAQRELDAKARAQGVHPRGVPVIDVYGTLVLGFDARRVGQLLAAR